MPASPLLDSPPKLPNPYSGDPREKVIRRRLDELVGSFAADLFIDACRIVNTSTNLKSSAHLLAHLLREIDGKIRDILAVKEPEVPMKVAGTKEEEIRQRIGKLQIPIEPQVVSGWKEAVKVNPAVYGDKYKLSESPGNGGYILLPPDDHTKSINNALRGLGIAKTEPIAQQWQMLAEGDDSKYKLHRLAHRGWSYVVPLSDEKVQEKWQLALAVYDYILQRFEENYDELFPKLDELKKNPTPSKNDASELKRTFPRNLVISRYFFNKLSIAWLQPLFQAGFFYDVNPPKFSEEGDWFQLPPWPEADYLREMALIEPAQSVRYF